MVDKGNLNLFRFFKYPKKFESYCKSYLICSTLKVLKNIFNVKHFTLFLSPLFFTLIQGAFFLSGSRTICRCDILLYLYP